MPESLKPLSKIFSGFNFLRSLFSIMASAISCLLIACLQDNDAPLRPLQVGRSYQSELSICRPRSSSVHHWLLPTARCGPWRSDPDTAELNKLSLCSAE